MAAFSLSALKTRLTTDPGAIGYSASVAARNDTLTAQLANDRTLGSGEVANEPISASEFLLVIAPDMAKLTSLENDGLKNWILAANIPVGDTRFQNWWASVVGEESFSSDVAALANRASSDMEAAFGAGFVVTTDQVSAALNLS